MTNWGDPQTLWVNLTNAGLGLVMVICIAVVGTSIVRELLERARARARLHAFDDDHAFEMPGLGWTMADGGERKNEDPAAAKTAKKK